MEAPKPKSEADFLIKEKGPDGKFNKIVGRAWKKDGPYGKFISLSIGPKEERKSFIMVDVPVERQATPAPEKPKATVTEVLDDEIPF